jgi:hypothetical protein
MKSLSNFARSTMKRLRVAKSISDALDQTKGRSIRDQWVLRLTNQVHVARSTRVPRLSRTVTTLTVVMGNLTSLLQVPDLQL